ncbi:Nucleoporin-62 C-terminal-like protein [Cyanidiococcus yangmingshanensis]|uniref:Nucleoporin-62 C-terminal-like protein n=1 Tax=Cyanidiococcus yangmingshanensis TaxID=2690220 RepID=A0A7J7IPB9_9RHOD|nr:Nucleoporin-62 C-terminal-like protein [Cyanidiococcus yangmingshanensis]
MSFAPGQGGAGAAGGASDDKKGFPLFSFGNANQAGGLGTSTTQEGLPSFSTNAGPSFGGASSGIGTTQSDAPAGMNTLSGEGTGTGGRAPSLFGQAAGKTPAFSFMGQSSVTPGPTPGVAPASQASGTIQPAFGGGSKAVGASAPTSFGFGGRPEATQTPSQSAASMTSTPKFGFGASATSFAPVSSAGRSGAGAFLGTGTPPPSSTAAGQQQQQQQQHQQASAQPAVANQAAGNWPRANASGVAIPSSMEQAAASSGAPASSKANKPAGALSFTGPGTWVSSTSNVSSSNTPTAFGSGDIPLSSGSGFPLKSGQGGQDATEAKTLQPRGTQTAIPPTQTAAAATAAQQQQQQQPSAAGKLTFSFGGSMSSGALTPSLSGVTQSQRPSPFSFASGPTIAPVATQLNVPSFANATGTNRVPQTGELGSQGSAQPSDAGTRVATPTSESGGGFSAPTRAAATSSFGAAPTSFRFGSQTGADASAQQGVTTPAQRETVPSSTVQVTDSTRFGKEATSTTSFPRWTRSDTDNPSTNSTTQADATKTTQDGLSSGPPAQDQSATFQAKTESRASDVNNERAPSGASIGATLFTSVKTAGLAGAGNSAPPALLSGRADAPTQSQKTTSTSRDAQAVSSHVDAPATSRPSVADIATKPLGANTATFDPAKVAETKATTSPSAHPQTEHAQRSMFSSVVGPSRTEEHHGAQGSLGASAPKTEPASGPNASQPGTSASTVTIPSAIEDKNVGEITTFFQETLDRLIEQFHRQAQQVTRWDRQVIEQQERLVQLVQETEHTETMMHHLEKELDFILQQQGQMHKSLAAVEEQVKGALSIAPSGERVWQSEFAASLTGAVEQERDKYHRLAEQVKQELDEVYQILERTIGELNSAQSTSGGERSGRPAGGLVTPAWVRSNNDTADDDEQVPLLTILNVHLDALELLNAQKNDLEQRIGELEKLLHTIGADPRFSRPPIRT